ncbi:MAG TPA: ComEC/Rec2 family competence protein [Acidimicrobiales bacterium]|nr:ComEC/Rec2 family competence protein [Acidimicrobiales bacterium]
MSERWRSLRCDLPAVVVAGGAWAGASLSRAVPVWVLAATAALVVVVRLLARRPAVAVAAVGVGVGVLASGLGARSLAGLAHVPEGSFDDSVTLVGDPEPTPRGHVRAEVRAGSRRLLAEARAPAATEALAGLLAGDRVHLRGQVAEFAAPSGWVQSRHLAGRLRVEAVVGQAGAAPHAAAANGFRRVLERGTVSLPHRHRALLAGLTLGDDRRQPAELTADFRASGLSHLLAVSGSNVVLVLAVAGPLLRRLRTWPRFVVATAAVLAFAFVTRFEPSVVRAAAMATVALWASTTGRPSGGLRHLALAVCALVLVDPLLTRAIGFRLSVAACVGILLLAPPLVAWLPGPRWVAQALGTTVGAQLAVAPVLVPTFGAMPLAALPANVAAAPLAAALMVWGISAGTVAGVLGGTAAAVLHLPSSLALHGLELVASLAAALPVGHVDLRHVAVLAIAAVLVGRAGTARLVGLALVLAVLVLPGAVVVAPGSAPAGWAATVWSDGPVAVVELDEGASAVEVLDVLRRRRAAVVGLVVVRSPRAPPAEVVRALRARLPVRAVLVPEGSSVPGATVPRPGDRVRVGGFRVEVADVAPVLVARVGWAGSGTVTPRR